jgi:hypothetical protein
MYTVKLPITWCSNDAEYIDTPTRITLEFSDETVEKIKRCLSFAIQENVTVQLDHWASEEVDEDGAEVPEWRADIEKLSIRYDETMYYKAHHKHNSGAYIESEVFTLEDILNNATVEEAD